MTKKFKIKLIDLLAIIDEDEVVTIIPIVEMKFDSLNRSMGFSGNAIFTGSVGEARIKLEKKVLEKRVYDMMLAKDKFYIDIIM